MSIAAHTARPLRHVVILGHPATGSFNHAIAERYCEVVRDCGQEVVLRDLYALDFDPRLHADRLPGLPTNHLSGDVSRELGLLHGADVIVFVYPLWFGMPPAMIKGYVDRVLGEALTPRDIKNHIPDAILRGKRFATFSTSATTRAWLEEQGQWRAMHQAFDVYLLSIFGMHDGGHTHFDAIVDPLDPHYAAETLLAVEERARVLCSTALAERHSAAAENLLNDRG